MIHPLMNKKNLCRSISFLNAFATRSQRSLGSPIANSIKIVRSHVSLLSESKIGMLLTRESLLQTGWNSTSFDEFSRRWNIPVHAFLLRHVCTSFPFPSFLSRSVIDSSPPFLVRKKILQPSQIIVSLNFKPLSQLSFSPP